MIKITGQSVKEYFIRSYKELIVLFAILFIDLLSKGLVEKFMQEYDSITLIPKFLNIFFVYNTRVAFGMDFGLSELLGESGMRIFFIIFVTIATAIFAVMLVLGSKKRFLYRLSLSMIVAGALGNLIDRIFCAGVRDFIQIEYFGKTILGAKAWPTFNIADASLVIGAIIFLVYFIAFYDKDHPQPQKELSVDSTENTAEITEVADDTPLKTVAPEVDDAAVETITRENADGAEQ